MNTTFTTTTRVLLSLLILSLVGTHSLAQLSAPMRNYNVTSPVSNGPYVVDRILPCTYRLMSDVDSSSLRLQIILKPVATTPTTSSSGNQQHGAGAAASAAPASAAAASPTTGGGGGSSTNSSSSSSSGSGGKNATQPEPIVITDNADVSKTEASAKHDGNITYYEHSFNFKIPSTVAPGRYNVVFFDASTNTELPIPIEIRSAAPAQSPNGSSGGKTLGGSSNGNSNDGHSQSIFASSTMSTPSACTFTRIIIMLSIVMFAFAV